VTRVTALAGGVGAAKLLRGIIRVIPPPSLAVIVNTGDDERFYGLHVSPDVDTTIYTLAGVAPVGRGWGIAGDTSNVLGALERFYTADGWFRLGDQDFATHVRRTHALADGRTLAEVTAELARAFGVESRILPMSDDTVRTIVETRSGETLSFQEYFVKRQARDRVRRLRYRGQRSATPAPGVIDAIRRADLLILPPSNPFTSIRPILGIRGIEHALRRRRVPLVAVSPIAGGRAVRGPLGDMLRAAGFSVSPVGIAEAYRGLLDGMVIDSSDQRWLRPLERSGLAVTMTDVRMDSIPRSVAVARATVALAQEIAGR
jgi:LPPG:FO 2-phospho-L-lactate transferase